MEEIREYFSFKDKKTSIISTLSVQGERRTLCPIKNIFIRLKRFGIVQEK